jgi:uncharacterized peroxidase-related enzyme
VSIVKTVPEEEATGLVAELYAEDIEDLGYVPSHSRVMALNPEAVRGFEQLMRAIAIPLGKRRYELVTLAAAEAIGSQACLLAHSRKTLSILDAEQIARILRDYRDAGLTDAEVAMMDYAARLSTDSASMTDADSRQLRDAGFTDREIVDITLAAAARNFYSRSLHALAVEVDVPPGLDDAIVSAITRQPEA